MGTRVVGITSACILSVRHSQLVVQSDNGTVYTVPIEDIGVLILDNQGVRLSHAVLQTCLENNVAVIVCGAKHLPEGLLQPLTGNSLQAKIQRDQLEATLPRRKQLWQLLVRTKILQQAEVLKSVGAAEPDLSALAARVRSGDPDNLEAQAARLYWRRLFGAGFRRDPDGGGINSMLNYGYAVMRAAVARAVVSSGLNPVFSVHHKNQYNPFALVDDLVEPLRPRVDIHVRNTSERWKSADLTPGCKRDLLGLLTQECRVNGLSYPLLVGLERFAVSVRTALTGNGDVRPDIPLL